MTTTIILHNDFHNTTAAVRPVPITEGRFVGQYKISRATAMRLRRQLCGSPDCTCGGEFGQRPHAQGISINNQDYERNLIVSLYDKTGPR